jgi:predicted DCC family thiol-disulfide oxidoreductase YuxK
MQHAPQAIIVFDTDCVLCSRMVAFVLAHEAAPFFSFVGAWSPTGLALAEQHGFSQEDLNETFLIIIDGVAHHHSDAGVELLRRLRQPWRWLSFMHFVPRALRDPVYSFIARHRYQWFGHQQGCSVPAAEHRQRFVDLNGQSPRRAYRPALDQPSSRTK